MIWVFLILSLATISYALYLLMEHLREAGVIGKSTLRFIAESESVTYKITETERDRDGVKALVVDCKVRVTELENLTSELQTKIDELKKEDERRGRFRLSR